MTDFISQHLLCRNPRILAFEEEAHRILEQCSMNSVCYNNLNADFRYDIICQAYHRFEALGLNLKKLFKFQRLVPAIYPWNIEYAALRFNVNRRYNVFPLVIIMAETECDVIRSYKFARKYNIPISLRGGAHCFEPFSLSEGMIIDQSRRKKIQIKSDSVKCEAGVFWDLSWNPFLSTIRPYLLGVVQIIISWDIQSGEVGSLTRVFGLGSDNILKVKILLASGKVIIVDENNYPDLFFALKGAGNGTYGIVLSATYRTYDINKVWSFAFTYPLSNLQNVLDTWISWIQTNPIRLTSDIIFTKRGVSIAGIFFTEDRSLLEKYLIPLRALHPTEMRMGYVPYLDVVKQASGTSRWAPFFKFKNAFINPNFSGPQVSNIITKYFSLADDRDYMIIDNLGGVNDVIKLNRYRFCP